MNISEVPLDVLNRFAAEKYGWTLGGDGLWIEPTGHFNVPLPDFSQAAGMKMLLERMTSSRIVHFYTLGRREHEEALTINICVDYPERTLGRAVLEAFVINEGYKRENQ